MLTRALCVLALLCLVSACDSTRSLRELRSAAPTDDPYRTALANGYRDFSEQKEAGYDWWTSKYFADKGLMAAYGREVTPEDPAQWGIAETQMAEFTDARTKLLASIEANHSTQPELAAAAAVAYDRWVEVTHNRWDVAAIEERRDVFFAILTKLEEVHVAESAEAGPVAAATPVESTSTVLYFPLDSDRLGDSAEAALAELVRYVQTAGNVTIAINGHADRVGSDDYNLTLSERRARFVMEALAKAGVPAGLMKYFAFGETDPSVPTADGTPEPKNRRVEIFIE